MIYIGICDFTTIQIIYRYKCCKIILFIIITYSFFQFALSNLHLILKRKIIHVIMSACTV